MARDGELGARESIISGYKVKGTRLGMDGSRRGGLREARASSVSIEAGRHDERRRKWHALTRATRTCRGETRERMGVVPPVTNIKHSRQAMQ